MSTKQRPKYSWSTPEKRQAVFEYLKSHTVIDTAKAFGVSRESIAKWLRRDKDGIPIFGSRWKLARETPAGPGNVYVLGCRNGRVKYKPLRSTIDLTLPLEEFLKIYVPS